MATNFQKLLKVSYNLKKQKMYINQSIFKKFGTVNLFLTK